MVKARNQFVCQQCGASFAKWTGKCPNCGEWNTLVDQVAEVAAEAKSALAKGQVSGKKLGFKKAIAPATIRDPFVIPVRDLRTTLVRYVNER